MKVSISDHPLLTPPPLPPLARSCLFMCFYTALGGVTRGSRRCLTEVWGASRAIPALGELGGEGEESGAAYLRAVIHEWQTTFDPPATRIGNIIAHNRVVRAAQPHDM